MIDSPLGIAGPRGIDPKIVEKIHDACKKAIEEPAVIVFLDRSEIVPNDENAADDKRAVDDQIALERGCWSGSSC